MVVGVAWAVEEIRRSPRYCAVRHNSTSEGESAASVWPTLKHTGQNPYWLLRHAAQNRRRAQPNAGDVASRSFLSKTWLGGSLCCQLPAQTLSSTPATQSVVQDQSIPREGGGQWNVLCVNLSFCG